MTNKDYVVIQMDEFMRNEEETPEKIKARLESYTKNIKTKKEFSKSMRPKKNIKCLMGLALVTGMLLIKDLIIITFY